MNNALNHDRSLATIVSEMKTEFHQFIHTRLEMLRQEIQEKFARLKVAAPLATAAIVLFGTAYLLITGAIVVVVAGAFGNHPYRWFFAFMIVGVVWALLGGLAAYFAMLELQPKTLGPTKTLEVLRQDKLWLQREVNHQV